jgi:hypothetical protein
MRGKYLGDSYDLIKRVWCDTLRAVAPLHAHPRFVSESIRAKYTEATSIPILDPDRLPKGDYGLLLDPHTGVRLPEESATRTTASHAPLPFVVHVTKSLRPAYVICFDQSYHRRHALTVVEQRNRKRAFLEERGISSFYYVSHAPFLFLSESRGTLVRVRERLTGIGIPGERFEPENEATVPSDLVT